MRMSKKSHTFQVVCIGIDCKAYGKCGNDCILKPKFQRKLKGCTYCKKSDCNHCSHKKKCLLIKPYSDELDKIERKKQKLEMENDKLFYLLFVWRKIEDNLKECPYTAKGDCEICSYKNCFIKPHTKDEPDSIEYEKLKKLSSVTDVIYLDSNINTEQKILDKISRNKLLINAYLEKEEDLVKNMSN